MRDSFRKFFGDPHVIALLGAFAFVIFLIWLLGAALTPIVVAAAIAYALDDPIARLERRGLRRRWGVALVYTAFLLVYVALLAGALPVAIRQGARLAAEFPQLLIEAARHLSSLELPWLQAVLPAGFREDLPGWVMQRLGQQASTLVQESFSTFGQVTVWAVNLVLIPLMVLFFLLDKERLLRGLGQLLPRSMLLVDRVWEEMKLRLSGYVRGKVWEILIVGFVMWVAFVLLDFRFALIMAIISGLSVLIPYVGAFAVALPLFLLGLFQWGLSWELVWLLAAYALMQFLDGNVLVPLLFSEAVEMPPTMILIGIIVFGALWGVWGVFFAIPLATLCKALAFTWVEWRENARELA